jgi:PAS domain S-box-containing protein
MTLGMKNKEPGWPQADGLPTPQVGVTMTALPGKKARSIRSRLILLLLSILIPVLAIKVYIYYENYQARRAAEIQANLEMARAVAKSFESFIQDVLHQELAIGLALTSSQPMTARDVTRLLETSRDYVAVRDFTWMNAKGVVVYSSNPAMVGIDYSDRSYFREVAKGREWMVSELIIGKTSGKPVFGISHGIRDGKGALLGVVFAAIIPEKLDARLAFERGKGGGHALVDNKGMLVYRYPAITATWEERYWLKIYPEFEAALKGKEIAATVYAPFEGTNRLVGFVPVPSIGWAASAGKREEDVAGPTFSSIGKSALLFLLVSFTAFIVALVISKRITNPVAELHAHALSLGRGDVTEQIKIGHVAEFQDLAEAFNTMAGKIQARERDLRESEQRWATTLASIGDAVIATDVEGRITFMNTVAEELTGWTAMEAVMKPVTAVFNIVNEHTRREVESPIAKVIREGMIVGLANHTILIKKEGTEVPIDDSGAPIRDKEGGIIGVVLVFRDISERKQAEAELQETLQRFYTILSHMQGAILLVGNVGQVEFANQAFCYYFNLKGSPAELIGMHSLEMIGKIKNAYRHADEEAAHIAEIVGRGKPVIGEEVVMQGDRVCLRDFIPIYIDEKSCGRLWHHMDITELKKSEKALKDHTHQLEAANRELESFAYSVSHDLRAPLRAIDGFSRMLLAKSEAKFDADEKRRFEVIRDNTRKMNELIDDLLDFSRLGRQDVNRVEIGMGELIRDVWQELITISPDREMSLTIGEMPAPFGDRMLIRQVCSNLLGNAVKFTQGRDPAVIEAGCLHRNGEPVYFIRDNGIGFDMKFHDKIFGVFERLHGPNEYEGTGIGLALVHRIILRHGGRVWAEGKAGGGATFYFTLP